MYCTKKITDDLCWIGGNDRRLALFENVFPVERGVSYNSYLLSDEKTVDVYKRQALTRHRELHGLHGSVCVPALPQTPEKSFQNHETGRGIAPAFQNQSVRAIRRRLSQHGGGAVSYTHLDVYKRQH